MADNVTLNSGSGGSVLATEDEGSVHYQKVKLTASGSGTTEALSKAEDTQHSTGEHGIMPLAVRNDTLAALGGTDGDYAPLQVNASGALYTDVTAVVPGTGATSLGKALDSPVGSTDTGILMLGVHKEESVKIEVADEDYAHLHIGELGGLLTEPEAHHHFNEMDSTSGWTVLGNDTTNLATTKKHLTGTDALTFDKADGAANTVFAGIQNTITSVNLGGIDLHDTIQTVCYLSSIADVNYVFVRVGTDSSNYNEWRVLDSELTAGDFQVLGLPVGAASQAGITGNGWDPTAITYIAVGVAFDNQNNTLSGIIFDQLGYFSGQHSTTSITSEVSSSVSSPNVNVKKWGSINVTTNSGNADSGTLRVVQASDQDVGIGVRTSGGTSIFRSIDLDEGALEVVKASAGQIYWMHVMNLSNAVVFVKIYNATSGTYGTGTPELTFPIPTQGDTNGAGFTLSVPNGIAFATGISIGAGTGVADNDTGAPGANDVIVNLGYA